MKKISYIPVIFTEECAMQYNIFEIPQLPFLYNKSYLLWIYTFCYIVLSYKILPYVNICYNDQLLLFNKISNCKFM